MQTRTSPGFGELLRRQRVAAGLTQEELAQRAGLSARAVSDLERGVKSRPHRDTIRLLAEALNLPAHERTAFEAARGRRSAAPVGADSNVDVALHGRQGSMQPPFVGRVPELALLERHLVGEGPPVLLLAGEPGIGKTRLLREAAGRAGSHGWCVLAGGCQRRGGQEPYAPVLDALKGHLRQQAPAVLRADLRGCAWLVRLLPELAAGPIEPLPGWTLAPEQERRLMFEAAARYLENVAGPAGTLLLLDDLQWAGPDALDLLVTLVCTRGAADVRVIGAYRDTEVRPTDALSVALADLAQAGLATQCPLGPLLPEEVDRLLDGLLAGDRASAPEVRERVVQRAGGVPFFVLSCAQALRLGAGDSGGADAVPWDVAQGIRQRVAALGEAAQEVLGVAAVVGRAVEPALLAVVAEQPEWEVLRVLEAASRARLLVEEDTGCAFGHDLIREVVEGDVGVARRRALHRRVAEVLEDVPGAVVERLAYHYGRAGVADKAAFYLERAGDRATGQAAHGTATAYYQESIERLEGLGRTHDATGVREKLGGVLLTAARYDAAVAMLEVAAQAYRVVGYHEGEGRAIAQIGIAFHLRGRPQEGLAHISPVLERLDAGAPSPGLASLYLALAYLYFGCGQVNNALVAAERASALASTLGNDVIRAQAEAMRGDALDYLGRVEEALPVLDGAISLAEATGQAFALCDALNMTAHSYGFLGEFARAKAYVEHAMAVAERAGEQFWMAFLHFHLGFLSFRTGDWAQARRHGEQAVVLHRHIGTSFTSGYGELILGQISYGEGHWDEATGYLEQTVREAESTAYPEPLRMAQSVLAEIEIRQGRPAAARARLRPLLGEPRAEGRDIAFLLPTLAWAHLDLGELAMAVQMADEAVAYARAKSDRLNLVEALRVQALVALRRENWAQAAGTLDDALALAQGMPYPWANARVLHVYGQMHAQKREVGPAQERLAAAQAIYQRLGAHTDAACVAQAIRDLSPRA